MRKLGRLVGDAVLTAPNGMGEVREWIRIQGVAAALFRESYYFTQRW